MDIKDILSKVDHTLLNPKATWEEIKNICDDGMKYCTASVCIPPSFVKRAKEYVGENLKICTVIGFPQGATPTEVKVFETKNAIENGATEVDMVIPVGVLKDKDYIAVENDIRAVVEAAKSKALTKVIIETCLLTDEEKIMACKLSKSAGADFVKTSTGFSTAGATVKDIRLMRETVGEQMGVKASGGVRSREDADAMIKAGATRIGTSNGVKIVEG